MPYLTIQTNQELDKATQNTLMARASAMVSAQLGKPESYVMVAITPPRPMMFAGSNDPTAFLELKSIGLPPSETSGLSASLCGLVADQLSINQNRIYIEFTDAAPKMWGWNGTTF